MFNNFLIATPCCTHTLLFQKLPSLALAPAPTLAPESKNAPVLHRLIVENFVPLICVISLST